MPRKFTLAGALAVGWLTWLFGCGERSAEPPHQGSASPDQQLPASEGDQRGSDDFAPTTGDIAASPPVEFDVAWGGFYASLEAEGQRYSVFRLIDFNQFGYHAALYREKFDTMPSVDQLKQTAPFIGHAPIALGALLRERDLQLIGREPLTTDDLDGYLYYLEAHEVGDDERAELADKLVMLSQEPTLTVTLVEVDGEVEVHVQE